jgi:hypothetical protein
MRQDASAPTRKSDAIFFYFSNASSGLYSLKFCRNRWHRPQENHRPAPAPCVDDHAHPLEIGIPVLFPSLLCFLHPRHRISQVTISSTALATSTVFPSLLLAVAVAAGSGSSPAHLGCGTAWPRGRLAPASSARQPPPPACAAAPDGPLPFSLALSSEHPYRTSGWPSPFVLACFSGWPGPKTSLACCA